MELISTLPWLLPTLLLVGAAALVLRRRRRASLQTQVVAGGRGTRRRVFPRREFSVTESRRAGPDGRIDLELTKRGEYYLVQCKHWRTPSVDVDTVREFHRVMAARHAVGGFVVTSGSFSNEAQKFAESREIELINEEQLAAMT